MSRAFSQIPIPTRPPKPRETGLTMMIDWGMGLNRQEDLLSVAHPFMDIAKIAVGIAGLIDEDVLRRKISLYAARDVHAFVGGQFLEFTVHHQGLDAASRYFAEARRVGFTHIEVSDNTLTIDPEDKIGLIHAARDQGLVVLGEVGSKLESSSLDALVAGINGCVEAGAWKVFLEGAEFIDEETGKLREDVIHSVASRVDTSKLMFELPGIWIRNVRPCDIHGMTVHLIDAFGPEVNIANVMPDWVVELETLRTGVGVTGV